LKVTKTVDCTRNTRPALFNIDPLSFAIFFRWLTAARYCSLKGEWKTRTALPSPG
jgi:hypothetical protein